MLTTVYRAPERGARRALYVMSYPSNHLRCRGFRIFHRVFSKDSLGENFFKLGVNDSSDLQNHSIFLTRAYSLATIAPSEKTVHRDASAHGSVRRQTGMVHGRRKLKKPTGNNIKLLPSVLTKNAKRPAVDWDFIFGTPLISHRGSSAKPPLGVNCARSRKM